MKKPQLSKKESEVYSKIIEKGSMDDMFDLGYAIGRARHAQESLEELFGFKPQFSNLIKKPMREEGLQEFAKKVIN